MCGIAGILGRGHDGFAAAAERHLRHRGPDDQGQYADPSATLVHCRLAIMDPSAAGHQPMVSACGRYVIVFNGEIYNHRELRRSLVADGVSLRSVNDAEVVLALFICEGRRCLSRLRGMYALCIWDREARAAFLARDPLGIKPLYRWHGPDGSLAFASEVRGLLATGLMRRSLDTSALAHYLAAGSLPVDRSLVAGITPLAPGYYGLWQDGEWSEERFWRPNFEAVITDRATAAVRARQALEASVQAHLTSDVPVGLFLSGGLDSGAVLALAGGQLPAISLGFAQAAHDESKMAARVAAHFGVEHHVLGVSRGLAQEWLPEFLAAMDQPSVDGFNTFCVARAARNRGFKTMLSGLGGDELFGGYPSFREIPSLLASRHRLEARAAGLAELLAQRSNVGSQRMAALLANAPSLAAIHRCYRSIFTPTEIRALMTGWGIPAGEPDVQSLGAADDRSGRAGEGVFPTDLDQLAWLETTNYLGNRLLRDADVFGMASSVEVRVPLCDATLLDALAPISAAIRLAPGKALLKRVVPELPEWLTAAPKRGFTFPFEEWFDSARSDGFLTSWRLPSVPPSLDLRHSNRRWSLLVLGEWLEGQLGLTLYARSSAA
jgi:asparagine synthase (glutamine-hydrolysing)